ncbi:hypothetical protein [Methylophaga sp. OBS3]|uniref:hypothetical protein n=1 Tax=Methylophaga sp. OBS3 TaxID=2991934 RepID=UPI002252D4ED|nr:hypothetical protein [Methylophaga sp. OBS3]MCX4189469.1 hypothetical protein [Methylophaga sp. OBS3]
MDESKSHKTLHQMAEKFRVPDKSFPSIYLPSTHVVFKLLGLPHNLPLMLETIENQYDLESNLTRSIKNKMVTTGVSMKHRDSYYNLVKQVIPDDFLFHECELTEVLNRSNTVGSNAGAWLNIIEGFCHSKGRFHDLDKPVIDFIKTRAHIDLVFLETSKNRQISSEDFITQTRWVCEFIRSNMNVPKETIDRYLHSVSKIQSPGDYSSFEHEDVLNILRFKISCEIDFFLAATAIYDSSIDRTFPELNLSQNYQKILLKYAKEDDIRTITESILCVMKDYYEPSLSWSGLASYLSCAEPKTTLNKWRKGKEVPSKYQFSRLIENLNLDSDLERFVIYQYFKASVMFDRLIEKWLKLTEKISLEFKPQNIIIDDNDRIELIKCIFLHVENYYDSFEIENHQPE